jgi:5'(3')-deoxyribonucleotidase
MDKQKKILYFDMDNVLVDFQSGIDKLSQKDREEYEWRYDDYDGIFWLMTPIPWAIEAFNLLSEHFDCYILSTSPWKNESAPSDKLRWVKKYLGEPAYKRLILTHNKHLNIWDYLIDDRTKNGADRFTGEHIHFWTEKFPDWDTVIKYLMK